MGRSENQNPNFEGKQNFELQKLDSARAGKMTPDAF
jgi:hypothetical protein